MYICNIIPLQKGIPFSTLTYFSSEALVTGTIVSIRIGNTNRFGIVLSTRSLIEEKSTLKNASFALKKIDRVCFYHESFGALVHALVQTSEKSLAPLGAVASTCISLRHLEQVLKIFEKKSISTDHSKKKINPSTTEVIIDTTKKRYALYRERVRKAFAKNTSVLIVVPTIVDAETVYEQITKGIEHRSVCLHSKKKVSEITKALEKIALAEEPIVIISTVSFSFIPRSDIGLIIIEKESSDSYISNDRFHIDTRLFIHGLATGISASLLYADIVPRFETLSTTKHDRFPAITNIQILEIVEPTAEKTSILPKETLELIAYCITHEKNIYLFSHRRGLAPVSRCKDCGTVVSCPNCALPLTLKTIPNPENKNERIRAFVCNHCAFTTSANHTCLYCRSWNIVASQIGTESIVEHIKEVFGAHAPVVEIESLQSLLTEQINTTKIDPKKGKIFVGTEHMLPYLEDIEYAVVPFFDRLISTPSYETTEKALRIILSICECAKSKAIIFSKSQLPFFEYIKKGTIERLLDEELALRKQFSFPPFGVFLKITVNSPIGLLAQITERVEKIFSEINTPVLSSTTKQVAPQSNAVAKSWILLVSDNWIIEKSDTIIDKLTAISPSVAIERNPHYFS